MKKLLNLSLIAFMGIFGMAFYACDEMPTEPGEEVTPGEGENEGGENEGGENEGDENNGVGEFSMELKSVGPDYVEVYVTAPNDLEVAYQIATSDSKIPANTLFRRGTVITVTPGQTLKFDEGLNENTTYYFNAAARLDDVTFSEVVSFPFTTEKYEFNEILTLLDTYPDGFKMHITVPQETKDRGNVMSFGYGNRALHNMNMFNSRGGGEAMVYMNAVASQSVANNDYCFNDTTLVVNDYNSIVRDADGNPVIGSMGEYISVHDPYIPGEPMVFVTGETRYGTKEEYADVVGWIQPTGDSWSVPMFDPIKMEWTGAFDKMEFFVDMPTECEATLEIEFPEDGLGINDAVVAFNPEGDFFRYYYMVLNKMAYEEIMTIFLDNDESLMQWFIVSWVAANYYTVKYDIEPTYINATQFFTEPLNGGETYYVVATMLGDDQGLTQRFVKKEFTTKERTKPAPVIDVTTVETGNPYLAGFNIKKGMDSRGNYQDIEGAFWACEYAREWQKLINAKYDFPTIIQSSYKTFTPDELALINSEKGLTVYFDMLDGETMRFGAYGCNDEYCFNLIDKDTPAGWADYKSPMAEVDKTPVSSAYFTDLIGDWTATATMKVKQMLEDETIVDMVRTHQSKVTISDCAPELPSAVDPYIYDLYGGMDKKDDVDGMFEELQLLSEQFTEYRLEKQNRLLCSGFLDFDGAKSDRTPVGRLDFRSPYDLFQATDYSSIDVAQLLYDFGPKWFLEVLPDGSVIVPFSAVTQPPLTAWPGYPFFIGGVNSGYAFYEATQDIKGFPVEVSPDGNTITIKPIVISDAQASQYLAAGNYYMNAIGVPPMSSDLEILGTITTDIVLTRGWNGVETSSVPARRSSGVTAIDLNDGSLVEKLPESMKIKSVTKLSPETIVQYKLDEEPNIVTVDMVRRSVEELSKYNFMSYGYKK